MSDVSDSDGLNTRDPESWAPDSLMPGAMPADTIPTFDLLSDEPLPPLPETAPVREPAAPSVRIAGSTLWLDGSVLMCACPDCGAPMTVRLWLLLADCWHCGTTIELTEEQEREALALLRQADEAARQAPPPPPAPANVQPAAAPREPAAPSAPAPAARSRADESPRRARAERRIPAAAAATHRRIRRSSPTARATAWLTDLFGDLPAWIVSLIFHVVLLTILGIITVPDDDAEASILLSAAIDRRPRDGGDTRRIEPTSDAAFDLPVPEFVDLSDDSHTRAMVLADQDARELRLTDPDNPHLPDLKTIRQRVVNADARSSALAARDPRVRVEMVKSEGGTTLTEAAVARGLLWLARHQGEDGAWSLDRFHRDGDCSCGGRASLHCDAAGTSLALLPFLGAGQTHLAGVHRDVVARGLRWMLENQKQNGDLRSSAAEVPGMYAHGQAAIVLCEAFLMTGDEQLRVPAQKAIDFIVNAQYPDGGWRYRPRDELQGRRRAEGDMSVFGWQMMALQSALAANLTVPDDTLENASHFLDALQLDQGAQYCYVRGQGPSPAMHAEGLLCRVYLGWKRDFPPLGRGVEMLVDEHPPTLRRPDIYYWYYATQTAHHYGGRPWERWNLRMRDVLVALQKTKGHEAGSWDPQGPHADKGGRIFTTALSVCCLEVYYRHLPIFRRIDLE